MPLGVESRSNRPSAGFGRTSTSRPSPTSAVTMFRRLIVLVALLLAPALTHARGIEPQLVAEGPAPPGGEVDLAIHMRTNPGWHGYWLNPGDAGLPMDVQWHLPKGFAAGPLRYPVPTRLTVAGLMNYVFDRDYAVLVRLKVPADAKGTVPIRAAAHWLACTDKICVPEQGQLALDLRVGSGTPNRAQFDAWRRALPQPLVTIGHFAVAGAKLRVAIPLPASVEIGEPYLFPITDNVVNYEAPQSFRRSGDWVVAELEMKKAPGQFSGVLASADGRGLQFNAVGGAGRRPSRDPRCWSGSGLGVPAPGPAYDHAPAAARGGDHRQPARAVRAAGARRGCPAGGQLRHGRTRCLRGDAVRRPVPRRGARDGFAPPARGCRRGIRGAGARARAAVRRGRLRSGAPNQAAQARPLDGPAQAFPCHSHGGKRRRSAVVAVSAERSGWSCRSRRVVRNDARGSYRIRVRAATGAQRRHRRRGFFDDVRDPRCLHRAPANLGWHESSVGRGSVERAARGKCGPARSPRVRLFHRRLVPDLQGQRSRGDRSIRGARLLQEGARHGICRRLDQRRSGDHPLPGKQGPGRSALLSVVCSGRGAGRAAAGPDALNAHCPRSGVAEARLKTRLPVTQVSKTCVLASDWASILVGSRSMMTKSAYFPGSSAPIFCSAKPA